jgi:hypothetical protein
MTASFHYEERIVHYEERFVHYEERVVHYEERFQDPIKSNRRN